MCHPFILAIKIKRLRLQYCVCSMKHKIIALITQKLHMHDMAQSDPVELLIAGYNLLLGSIYYSVEVLYGHIHVTTRRGTICDIISRITHGFYGREESCLKLTFSSPDMPSIYIVLMIKRLHTLY